MVMGDQFIKMEYRVEVLKKRIHNTYGIDESQSESFSNLDTAKARGLQLKNEVIPHKVRLIEYHNDESDAIRTACKILKEF